MINRDDARYVYLRDDESSECWNIGLGPLNTEVEDYCCTHSIGHSLIRSKKNGVEGSWRIFVPKEGHHEVWTLKLKNTEATEKHLSVFSAVSFNLEGFSYPRYYEMYRCMQTRFAPEVKRRLLCFLPSICTPRAVQRIPGVFGTGVRMGRGSDEILRDDQYADAAGRICLRSVPETGCGHAGERLYGFGGVPVYPGRRAAA